MKKPKETFTLNIEQGDELILRLAEKSITQDDYAMLINITRCYFWLILSLREAKISMRRFKAMIFGSKKTKKKDQNNDTVPNDSEQTSDVPAAPTNEDKTQGDASNNDETPGSGNAAASQNKRTPAKGHGRLGANAYTGATDIACTHSAYTVAMPCPQGGGRCGTLHHYPSGVTITGVTITVDGCAPLHATRYTLEKRQCSGCRTIYTADLPPQVNASEKYTPGAKATLAVLHYGMAVPFNRLERLQSMMGVPLPDATQWELVEQVADHVYPVYDYMIYLAAQSWIIYQDDTGVRILSLMKENKNLKEGDRKGMYSTGLVSQTGDNTLVLFFSGRQHAGENRDRLLTLREDNQGAFIKMSDALNANNPALETEAMIEANCSAHAVRKFTELEDFFPGETRTVIDRFKAVFDNERQVKADNLSDDERLHYPQTHSEPEMSAIKAFVEQQVNDKAVEPHSSLGKAYQYLLNHWEKLTRFLITPGAPLDNNLVERALKWMIQVRKNSLFYATEHGAYVGSLLISLIATCGYAKVDPIDYLAALQQERSAIFQHPGKWLPWNYHLTHSEPPP